MMAYLPTDPDCPYQAAATLHLGFGPRTEALLGAGPVQPKAKQNFRLHSSAGHRLFDIHNSRTKIKLR